MAESPGSPPRLTPARRAEHHAREKRLAAALRENFHRRKEQARARDDEAATDRPTGSDDDAADRRG